MSDCPEVNLVAFDLDDTLYSHRQYVLAGFEAVSEEVKTRTGTDIYDDLVVAYFGDEEYHRTFDVVLESHNLPIEMVDDLVAEYHSVVGDLSLYPAVPQVLEALADHYRLGLITDGKNARKKMKTLGLLERFDFVLATEHHGFSKQNETPFRLLLNHFETEPNRAVYVGNDPRIDFRQPNQLGMHTVHLRRGTLASIQPPDNDSIPDHVIEEVETLPEIVRRVES
jgi:putative hydrolase of the HAD superfamily